MKRKQKMKNEKEMIQEAKLEKAKKGTKAKPETCKTGQKINMN